ncbi:MAG: SPOR domain-containing protein [Spirochaetia bacterium]
MRKHPRNRINLILLLLLLLLFTSFQSLSAQDILSQADTALKLGDREKGLELFTEWLSGNTTSEKYPEILFKTAALIKGSGNIIEFLGKHAENNRVALLGSAKFAETAGFFDTAQQWYEEAAYFPLKPGQEILPPHPEDLLKSAALLAEMDRSKEAADQIKKVLASTDDVAVIQRASLLAARILAATGKIEEAITRLSLLHKTVTPRKAVLPESLLFLYMLSKESGDETAAAETYGILEETFPESPEHRIAERIKGGADPQDAIIQYPSPFLILNLPRIPQGQKIVPGIPEEKPENSTDTHRPSGIQVGSFTMQENSKHLLNDLEKKGISGSILETSASGKTYYKVVVPVGKNQNPQDLLKMLSDAGYEGFFVF